MFLETLKDRLDSSALSTRSNCRCPCSLQTSWTRQPLRGPSHSNASVASGVLHATLTSGDRPLPCPLPTGSRDVLSHLITHKLRMTCLLCAFTSEASLRTAFSLCLTSNGHDTAHELHIGLSITSSRQPSAALLLPPLPRAEQPVPLTALRSVRVRAQTTPQQPVTAFLKGHWHRCSEPAPPRSR